MPWRNVVTSTLEITRKIEFDAGHRIPDHGSKCRNIHGHRYVLEATIRGFVNETPGKYDTGMVQDFGVLKTIMMEMVGEPWDHSFLVSQSDTPMIAALKYLPLEHKTVSLPFIPTVENLAKEAFRLIDKKLRRDRQQLFWLQRIRLYETPNCWADYDGGRKE
jgi:6-pyruvoyltetrahydropterin/6-carboxytetrahydropterin synthase